MIKLKRGIASLLLFVIIFTNVAYAEDITYTNEEQEDLKTVYEIKNMMDNILNNYVGGEVTREKLIEGAMKGMFGELDPYSQYYTVKEYMDFIESVSGEFVGIGIKVQKVDAYVSVVDVIKNTPAEKSGILPGDAITMIDDTDVSALTIEEAIDKIKGEKNTKVILTIKRGADTLKKEVIRDTIQINAVSVQKINELFPNATEKEMKKLRYMNISEFNSTVYVEFKKAITEMKEESVKGIIIDLRNNPGGYLDQVINMCKLVVPAGPIVHTVDKAGNKATYKSELKKSPFSIVVLVNGNTASASEIMTGAIKDSKSGIIVGETTYGKGVVQKLFRDVYGNYFKLTVEEYLTRNGTYINKIGIQPDIIVEIPDYIDATQGKYAIGDKSDEVEQIEKVLYYLGYSIKSVDKTYGQDTFDAISKFQMDNELFPYGVADYTTQGVINETLYKKLKSEDKQLEAAYEILKKKVLN